MALRVVRLVSSKTLRSVLPFLLGGERNAAEKALDELHWRRSKGQQVYLFEDLDSKQYIVGPKGIPVDKKESTKRIKERTG